MPTRQRQRHISRTRHATTNSSNRKNTLVKMAVMVLMIVVAMRVMNMAVAMLMVIVGDLMCLFH